MADVEGIVVSLRLLVVGNGKSSEKGVIARNERFLFLCTPALDLGLTTAGFGERREFLSENRSGWRIQFCGAAGLTRLVISLSLAEICRGTGVKPARLQM